MPLKLIVDSEGGIVTGAPGLLRLMRTATIEEIDTTGAIALGNRLIGVINIYLVGGHEIEWTTGRCPYLLSIYDTLPICQQEQLLVDIRSSIEEEALQVDAELID